MSRVTLPGLFSIVFVHLCSFAFLVVETNQTDVFKEPVKIATTSDGHDKITS